MKKICILGGCGYIGSHFCSRFSDCTLVDSVDLQWFGGTWETNHHQNFASLTKEFLASYEVIILVAAHSSVAMCNSNSQEAFQNNVVNFVNLVMKLQKRHKFIYAGSSCVYTDSKHRQSTEEELLRPVDGLSYFKTTIDNYMTCFNPCEYYGLRFGSVNGWSPNFRPDLMINAMTLSALKTGKLQVSNGGCNRPILGINDLGRLVQEIVLSDKDQRGIYNVASFNITIRDVARQVGMMLNAKVEEVETHPTYDFCMDVSKCQRVFDFKFEDDLRSIVKGIKESVDLNFDYPMRVRNV